MELVAWWPVISGLGAALLAAITWFITNKIKTDARLTRLEERVTALAKFWSSKLDS
jgi:heme/copper-type cytochrome/quinol oxidase subunit 2